MHSGEKPARFLSTILDTRNTRSPQHLQFTGSRSSWLRLLSFFLSFFLSSDCLAFLGMGFIVQAQKHTLLQIFATLFEHFERARECQQACSESLPKFIGVRSHAGVERPSCRKTYILDVHFNDAHKMLTKTYLSLAVSTPRKCWKLFFLFNVLFDFSNACPPYCYLDRVPNRAVLPSFVGRSLRRHSQIGVISLIPFFFIVGTWIWLPFCSIGHCVIFL